MTLIEALQTIRDRRRGAGRRYPLWVFLLLVILGTMSGYRDGFYSQLGDYGISSGGICLNYCGNRQVWQ